MSNLHHQTGCMLGRFKEQSSERYNRCVCRSRSASWRRSGCEVSIIVTDVKRNDALLVPHYCGMIVSRQVNIRYVLPEVLAASGIKPPGLTDRRKMSPSIFLLLWRRQLQSWERSSVGRMRLVELENLYWLSMLNR